MNPQVEQEIRRWLRRYLTNDVSLDAFEDWITDATWDIDRRQDPAAAQLSALIGRYIAEYGRGARTEQQLKRALRRFAPSWLTVQRQQLTEKVVGGLKETHVSRGWPEP